MKERIVVVPNSNKLSLSLAYKNKNTFNTRFLTPIELAREALLRSGIVCDKEFISRNDELIYYKSIIEEVEYFKTSKLADIKSVNQTINTIRRLIIGNEKEEIKDKLSKGTFIEKNNALFEVYEKYIDKLNNENKVDTIGLIRYAIENAQKVDTELVILKEYQLQPLELQLVSIVNDYKEISLFDLYEVSKKNIHIESFNNCYGNSNEVATIIDDIFSNNKADQCVVALADYPTYSQTFYDYACKYDINITFGNGLSLINSYPGKLLKQYYYWMSEGNFGWEPFLKLIRSPYFNFELLNTYVNFEVKDSKDIPNFWKRASKLRLTNNQIENNKRIEEFKNAILRDINDNKELIKYVPSLEALANEFALPIEEFLTKYCVSRNYDEFVINFDRSSIDSIINEIKTIKNIGLDITSDVIETLLKKPVYRQSNQPGYLHIVSINDALSSLRDNLYVCGLSSTIYPGSPKENPLLLDEDLKAFNNEQLTSNGKIKEKKETLFNLINLASSLDNKISLSYPGLNVSELKNNNASSLLYELYKQEYGDDKSLKDFANHTKKVDYFEPKLSKSRDIGNAYNDDAVIEFVNNISNNDTKETISLNSYSPTALNTFFECKKKFYYQNILKLDSPDDYNAYEIISASELGTLVHSLMEFLADNRMSKDDFAIFGGKVFDEYMKISVPLVQDNVENTKEQFLEMLANGWDMDEDNKREVAFKEENKTTIHEESGVKIHGYPDRVEYTKDHKAVIIDFKTENKINKHKPNDVDSCLQVLIYAYIVEKEMHLEIDHCEFRMLRFRKGIVKCKYDQEIKDQLSAKLIEFKEAIDTADFDIEPMSEKEAKEKCKYCKFSSICGREVFEDE